MTVDSAIAWFRERQAQQFTTEADVYRQVGEATWNPETERTERTYELVETGPCKIRPSKNRSTDEVQAGETQVALPDSEGKWPVDADLRRLDVVHVTASTHDAGLVGRMFTVTKVGFDEWQIARVAQIEETIVPELNLEES